MSSMVIPFVLPFLIEHAGLRPVTLFFVLCCLLGQWVFIVGLEQKSYIMCLGSRIIFGISDCLTIV